MSFSISKMWKYHYRTGSDVMGKFRHRMSDTECSPMNVHDWNAMPEYFKSERVARREKLNDPRNKKF